MLRKSGKHSPFVLAAAILISLTFAVAARAEEHDVSPPGEHEMVLVKGGTFLMGSLEGEGLDNEHPQHEVTVDSFWMDANEVTNAEFSKFVEATRYVTDAERSGKAWVWDDGWKQVEGADWRQPEGPSSDIESIMDHPVVQVSWNDASAYCRWAGKRLPTEAEWEYACRAGTTTKYSTGDTIDHDHANYSGTGGRDHWDGTSPVRSFPPNEWGLYDMHGNVWEWCEDYYSENFYKHSPKDNPVNTAKGPYRIMRGGAWDYCQMGMPSAYRGGDFPESAGDARGFRTVKSANM